MSSAQITKLTPTSLAAMLCAKICHDLISPVGALGNAVEILDDEDSQDMYEAVSYTHLTLPTKA